jgi:hypothetical protein
MGKEDIILIHDAAIGGHTMTKGARYRYIHESTDKDGIFHESIYICGTNIIQERLVNWSLFIKSSKNEIMSNQEIIDMITALTNVVEVNREPFGNQQVIKQANKKISELMELI